MARFDAFEKEFRRFVASYKGCGGRVAGRKYREIVGNVSSSFQQCVCNFIESKDIVETNIFERNCVHNFLSTLTFSKLTREVELKWLSLRHKGTIFVELL